jgi:hypothetical protein
MPAFRPTSLIISLAAVTLGLAAPWTPAAAAQWRVCAHEGGFCHAPYGAIVHYGRDGAYAERHSEPGGLPCNNDVFGDPVPGAPKLCFIYR